MYIPVLETSTRLLSVSLIDVSSEMCIATHKETQVENSHAKLINITIQNILEKHKIKMNEICAIAINEGPGSFTGLRVGSSTAKGFSFGLGIPMIAICGLAAYAKHLYNQQKNTFSDVFVLLDARRENYFYSFINEEHQTSMAYFKHISQIRSEMDKCANPSINYIDKASDLGAKELTEEVLDKWRRREFVDIYNFEPKYIVNNYIINK